MDRIEGFESILIIGILYVKLAQKTRFRYQESRKPSHLPHASAVYESLEFCQMIISSTDNNSLVDVPLVPICCLFSK